MLTQVSTAGSAQLFFGQTHLGVRHVTVTHLRSGPSLDNRAGVLQAADPGQRSLDRSNSQAAIFGPVEPAANVIASGVMVPFAA